MIRKAKKYFSYLAIFYSSKISGLHREVRKIWNKAVKIKKNKSRNTNCIKVTHTPKLRAT
jgi:hypothetical protein